MPTCTLSPRVSVLSAMLSLCLMGGSVDALDVPLLTNAKPVRVATGDLNGDGKLDLVTADKGNVYAVLGNGDGTFQAYQTTPGTGILPGVDAFIHLVLFDANHDGKPDLATTSDDVFIRVWLGRGNGTFDPPVSYANASNPTDLTAADFNGDGYDDLAAVANTANAVLLFLNKKDGTFATPALSLPTGSGSMRVAAGDMNNDGAMDLVSANYLAGASLSVLIGNGDGTFQSARTSAMSGSSAGYYLTLADLNNDTFLDIIHSTGSSIDVYSGKGDGTYGNPVSVLSTAGNNFGLVKALDYDSDGNCDLLFTCDFGIAPVTILLGNGTGVFQAPLNYMVGNSGHKGLAAADFNGDYQLDLVVTNLNLDFLSVVCVNPRPTLSSLSPQAAIVNAAAFTLTVTGSKFLPGATVQWNGQSRTTAYGSATQLSASIPASDLSMAGQAIITVANPSPGGFAGDSQPFSIYPQTLGNWMVTTTADSGTGSLRTALTYARSGDTITFDPQVFDLTNSDAATLINVLSELPSLDNGQVTLDASERRVTLNGSGAGSANGLVIASDQNVICGLSIVGFSKSGVFVGEKAAKNALGGNRNLGTGPNGQGLRIASNGAFGIHITGAASRENVVKGCWIGLDASGLEPKPNLAGILLDGGANNNQIGSTSAGEENVISGNEMEGITISGDGSDDNILLGNLIGVAGVTSSTSRSDEAGSRELSRVAVGNGSAGVFLSRGTKATRVGGEASGEGNLIAHNGGSGVEVRAVSSKRNSARGNRISGNVRGGIKLFDGANDGIAPPSFDSLSRVLTASREVSSRALSRVLVGGAAGAEGSVELFSDSGTQGGTFLGRTAVAGGRWQIEVDVNELENLTATLTDVNGNTSPFAVFGSVSGGKDSDGDGISDTLETLAGSDPNSASDLPLRAGATAAERVGVSLNFAQTNKDSLQLGLRLILPADFQMEGAVLGVLCGDVSASYTLDAKGLSPKGLSGARLKGAAGSTASLQVGLKSADLRLGLSTSGLSDRTTTGKQGEEVEVALAVALTSNGSRNVYLGKVKLLYKAVQGKGGKAKKMR